MTCGGCKFNDGVVYTSFPPTYRCTITGAYHDEGNECDCMDRLPPGTYPIEKKGVYHGYVIKFPPLRDFVVRCKDCRYYHTADSTEEHWCYWVEPKENDYCSLGERKDAVL